MTDDAIGRKGAARWLLFVFALPFLLIPLSFCLLRYFPSEVLRNAGLFLPFFDHNIRFLSRGDTDSTGVSAAFLVSAWVMLSYLSAASMILLAVISAKRRNEMLAVYVAFRQASKNQHAFPTLFLVIFFLVLVASVLGVWDSKITFSALHVYSNGSKLRTLLVIIQAVEYFFAVQILFWLSLGLVISLFFEGDSRREINGLENSDE